MSAKEIERRNVYVCPRCGSYIVTRDVDYGVTPMFWGSCETFGCDGWPTSVMYNSKMLAWAIPESGGNFDLMTPTWEWYKPDAAEYEKLSAAMKNHVDGGGLCRRKLKELRQGR